jgi:hypothetical protein
MGYLYYTREHNNNFGDASFGEVSIISSCKLCSFGWEIAP